MASKFLISKKQKEKEKAERKKQKEKELLKQKKKLKREKAKIREKERIKIQKIREREKRKEKLKEKKIKEKLKLKKAKQKLREQEKLKEKNKRKRQRRKERKELKLKLAKEEKRRNRIPKHYKYTIIITSYGKQLEFVKNFYDEQKAVKYYNEMLDENKKTVIMPKAYTNILTIEECNYELVLLKKKDDEESNTSKLRNEYGEYVEYATTNENWIVYDKQKYLIEEKFWVYGYSPLTQRKDFMFIFENIVKPYATQAGNMLNIFLFKNKIFFDSLSHQDMVVCMNKSDAIRLYNEIEKWCRKDKTIKYYIMSGDWGFCRSQFYKTAIEKIKNLTNWDNVKIIRYSTRPQKKCKQRTYKKLPTE